MNNILDNIRILRSEKGYSQDWMGKKMGITQNTYSLIEADKRRLSYKALKQIAIIFDMSVIDLITFPEKWGPIGKEYKEEEVTKVMLQIELKKEKKDQVLKLVFGDNNIEILNK